MPSASDAQSPTDNVNLQDMFSQFLKTSEKNQLRHQAELSAMNAVVDRISENSSLESTSDHVKTPLDRRQTNRRTSIFYGLNRGKRKANRDIGEKALVMLVTSLKLAS